MTLFFNLHRLDWKRTRMLRITLPRDSTLRLISSDGGVNSKGRGHVC